MRLLAVAVLMTTACGRISFDEIFAGASGDGGSDGDSGVFAETCFRGIATGNDFSCAIDSRGDVWCWGSNRGNQTDPVIGVSASIPSPRKITLPRPAVQITLGTWVGCARLDDNTARCWGTDAVGQLGDGPGVSPSAPVEPLIGDTISDIQAGASTNCARRASDQSVMCWGSNAMFEVGAGTGSIVDTPTLIAGTAGTRELAMAHHHGCLIDATDTVQCWGRGGAAEIGAPAADQATPRVLAGYGAAAHVARGGGRFTCVHETNGDVRCNGLDDMLQIGRADGFLSATPAEPITTGPSEVALGSMTGCALYPDHHVACWGDGTDGMLGPNNLAPTRTPVNVLDNVNELAVGAHHACVLRGSQILCWGHNEYGQLGRGSTSLRLAPAPVTGLPTVDAIALGADHMCTRSDTQLYCAGLNQEGQFGDGTRRSQPVFGLLDPGVAIEGVAASEMNTCVWSGGRAYCAGRADSGETGDVTVPIRSLAFNIVPVIAGVNAIDVGYAHACAINSGVVRCWGQNPDGELGDGGTTTTATPSTTGISGATDVSAGFNSTCAIAGGVLTCWGDNQHHQVSGSPTPQFPVPTATAGLGVETPVQVSVGFKHVCAVMVSGALYCWGGNDAGEVGNGTIGDQAVPVAVTLPSAAVEVRAGFKFTCARLTDGTVYCWGINEEGQLGNGTDNWSTTPVQVSGITDAVALDVGKTFACARRPSGALSCWGSERRGHLGSGVLTTLATPTPVALSCTP